MTPVKVQTCIAQFANGQIAVKREPILDSTASSPDSNDKLLGDAGDGPAKDWLTKLIKEDKEKYNRFAYRLRLISEETKDAWALTKQRGTAREAEAFLNEIASGKRKKVSEEKVIEETGSDVLSKEWTPYKQAADKYGDDVVTAMIKGKTVPCQMAQLPRAKTID